MESIFGTHVTCIDFIAIHLFIYIHKIHIVLWDQQRYNHQIKPYDLFSRRDISHKTKRKFMLFRKLNRISIFILQCNVQPKCLLNNVYWGYFHQRLPRVNFELHIRTPNVFCIGSSSQRNMKKNVENYRR